MTEMKKYTARWNGTWMEILDGDVVIDSFQASPLSVVARNVAVMQHGYAPCERNWEMRNNRCEYITVMK